MTVTTVQVLDDDPRMRATFADTVIDASLEPVNHDETWLGDLQDYLGRERSADAAITDFDLRSRGYAPFNGAELVAGWYARGYPAILCTRFEKTHIDLIRPYRQFVPVLLTPDELSPDSIVPAIEVCIREMAGSPIAERKPRRTQVHFVSTGEQHGDAYLAEVPAWGSEVVRLPHRMVEAFSDQIVPGFRCHASVNVGAQRSEDLFFASWEMP